MNVAEIEKLGKKYLILHKNVGHKSAYNYVALRDVIAEGGKKVAKRILHPFSERERKTSKEYFWALKDFDMNLKQGQRLGVIGVNGSGKSTLLKIISRITEPSEGTVRIKGRVSSLLEVGTGFHPELTGRENIFLNGAILGMKRSEIKKKFDQIVDFAEVERFLDTPVKRYSSGMYVRLAFSVAAHLEPDILLVDEVLAVGDIAFQKKCLGKLEDIGDEGRTLMFVSHKMESILNLCDRVVWISGGRLKDDGETDRIVREYVVFLSERTTTTSLSERLDRRGSGKLRITDFFLRNEKNETIPALMFGKPGKMILEYTSDETVIRNVRVLMVINDEYNRSITRVSTSLTNSDFTSLPTNGEIVCELPKVPIAPGKYMLTYKVVVNGIEADTIFNAAVIDIEAGDFFGSGESLQNPGEVCFNHTWDYNEVEKQ